MNSNEHRSTAFDGLTKALFQELSWGAIISGFAIKRCDAYQDRFRDKAKDLENGGRLELARAARVLQWVAALHMRLDNPRQPFQGASPMPGFAFPRPNDFGEPLLAIFVELAREAADPEFKARLADLCWSSQQKRGFTLVGPAIEAYLASAAINLCPEVASRLASYTCWSKSFEPTMTEFRLFWREPHGFCGSVQARCGGNGRRRFGRCRISRNRSGAFSCGAGACAG